MMSHGGDPVRRIARAALAAIAATALAALVIADHSPPGWTFVAAVALGGGLLSLGVRLARAPAERAESRVELGAPEPVSVGAEPGPVAAASVVVSPIAAPDTDSGVRSLVDLGLGSGLRQAALAIEQAGELGRESTGWRTLLSLAHSVSVRGQALLQLAPERLPAGAARRARSPERRQDRFAPRDEIAACARALAFELGREVALSFRPGFPAQVVADRVLLRLGVTAIVLEIAALAPERCELLLEASHTDQVAADVIVRVAVSTTGSTSIGALEPCAEPPPASALLGLASLVEERGGSVLGRADAGELGFSLPMVRDTRTTPATLPVGGTLFERRILVIDPRPIGRLTICEQLSAWHAQTTGVASVAQGLTAANGLRDDGQRFEVVIVSGFERDQAAELHELCARLPPLEQIKILSLEDLESACGPTEPSLAQVPGLVLRRMARPPSPNELIETLTALLVPVPDAPHEKPRRNGSGLSLLLAEDNAINQVLLVKMLERRGHTVKVARNGAELVDRFWEAPDDYDAILMDVQMPIMDGYEATVVIRLREAQRGRAQIPIVAVTAHSADGERERCIEVGMDHYLAKPFSDAELNATLDSLLARPRAAVPAATEPASAGVFDRSRLLELCTGDMSFLRGLIDLFAESAPSSIAQIAAQLEASEADAAYRVAHQLKGSISNFGAGPALAAAGVVEDLARRGELAEATRQLGPLRSSLDALIAGLRTFASERSS